MELTTQFKTRVIEALLANRSNFSGTDSQYAKRYGINSSVYSQIKNGQYRDGLLRDNALLTIGRELDVEPNARPWNLVKTEVFQTIEEEILFCKEYSKASIFVDEPEIGKTVTAKHLARTLPNTFYIDCSQCKTKSLFIRALAKAVGVDQVGTYAHMKAETKYRLKALPKPIVILDEAGDLGSTAFLDLKEFWNATEGVCGWYMMGADGLRTVIEKGISHEKVGYREIFSRFSGKFHSVVPRDPQEKQQFYRKMIQDVLSHNAPDKKLIPKLITKCLVADKKGRIGGLRRAESLLILSQNAA